jgi:membrane protease YdiL (CAAX protease family)
VQQTEPQAAVPPPGWYADPWRTAPYRWWDGQAWTAHVSAATASAGASYGSAAYAAPRNTTSSLPKARDDIHGGWIALLGFAGALALSLIFALAAIAAGAEKNTVPVMIAGQAGLWSGLWMAAYIVTHRREGGSLRDIGLRAPKGAEIGMGIGIALAAIYVEGHVIALLRSLLPPDNQGVRSSLFVSQPSVAALVVTALIACVGAPYFEEIFFRGVVQSVLMRRFGILPAVVIQAVLFGCAHYQLGMTANQAAVRIVGITIVGLFLGWLRAHTGRLGAGMVAHATNNIIVVTITYVALYGR